MSQTSVWEGSVLIVEGDPALRELYRWTLRAAGYAAVAVSDGLEALRHLESSRPDAIVLNLKLPHVSGRDVQQELNIRPDTRRIPIIVIGADETSPTRRDGFACVLGERFTADELVAAVRRCVERYRKR